MLAGTERAKKFRRWVLDVLEGKVTTTCPWDTPQVEGYPMGFEVRISRQNVADRLLLSRRGEYRRP